MNKNNHYIFTMTDAFYSILAKYYDTLFPVSENTAAFIKSASPSPPGTGKLLDAGCGTGTLILKVHNYFKKCIGIDSDDQMIRIAESKCPGHVPIEFITMDIRNLRKKLPPRYFNVITCLGNTLVHLRSIDEIRMAIADMEYLLSNGGVLIIQILNYDMILSNEITELNEIQTEHIVFKRRYTFDQNNNRKSITFHGSIEDKTTRQTYKSSTELLPIKKHELEALLRENGFSSLSFYGSFEGKDFDTNDLVLIVQSSNR
jgi:glycine/sarcosine N-methyltransferase